MLQPIMEQFADDGTFPNSRFALLIYRQALPADAGPDRFEALFDSHGWPPQWRSGIYPFHHYHSTAHECLGVAAGRAHIALGGPNGRAFDIAAGDVIVIPAGVAHRRLSASADFLVVGAYPPGQRWDLLRGEAGERPQADENIARVLMPRTDPVMGAEGGLLSAWE